MIKHNMKTPIEKIEGMLATLSRALWSDFIDHRTFMLYDTKDSERTKHLPTLAEIRQSIPYVGGWATAAEDCCLNGSMYLCGLMDLADLTGLPHYRDTAKKIFRGLARLGSVSKTRGFICRSVSPRDNTGHYINSSVDQYTMWTYAMWRYFHGPLASPAEKRLIAGMLDNVCRFIEKGGYTIRTETLRPGIFGEINRIDGRHRLLHIYLTAFDVTRRRRWHEIYLKLRDENHQEPLMHLHRFTVINGISSYSLYQNQVSLRTLYELEPEYAVKAAYKESMRLHAKSAWKEVELFKNYDRRKAGRLPLNLDWRAALRDYLREHPGADTNAAPHRTNYALYYYGRNPRIEAENKVRESVEAMNVILMSEDRDQIAAVRPVWKRFLETFHPEDWMWAHAVCYVHAAYAWGRKQGFLNEPDLKRGRFFSVDLRKHCNVSFADRGRRDEISADTGWTADGPDQDLRSIRTGSVRHHDVPFEILDPKTNGNRSCIILRNDRPPRNRLPYVAQVCGIPVKRKADYLFFLHTSAYSQSPKPAAYIVRYADGTQTAIEWFLNNNVRDWYAYRGKCEPENAKPVFVKVDKSGLAWALYLFTWKNPRPATAIASLDLVKRDRAGMPVLIAVTGMSVVSC